GLWLSGQGMRLHNLGPLEGEKPGEPQKHIEARTPVRVSYDDFRKQRLAVLRRVDRNLTSFPECEAEPTRAEIEAQLVGRRYVHQLNLLNLDDDNLEQHISD
ncbi:hypothetical protein, partial [Burkholderia ubonensis]|uniref:hypothetical protein n=1 Tax=Burkholderia ubonensis TaxID=101571 RepID=UPI001E390188